MVGLDLALANKKEATLKHYRSKLTGEPENDALIYFLIYRECHKDKEKASEYFEEYIKYKVKRIMKEGVLEETFNKKVDERITMFLKEANNVRNP